MSLLTFEGPKTSETWWHMDQNLKVVHQAKQTLYNKWIFIIEICSSASMYNWYMQHTCASQPRFDTWRGLEYLFLPRNKALFWRLYCTRALLQEGFGKLIIFPIPKHFCWWILPPLQNDVHLCGQWVHSPFMILKSSLCLLWATR